jgi:hypothetical protein
LLVFVVVAACSSLSAVLAVALVREVRLRRALEALLRQIFTLWRRARDDVAATDRDTDADAANRRL